MWAPKTSEPQKSQWRYWINEPAMKEEPFLMLSETKTKSEHGDFKFMKSTWCIATGITDSHCINGSMVCK